MHDLRSRRSRQNGREEDISGISRIILKYSVFRDQSSMELLPGEMASLAKSTVAVDK